MAFTIADAYVLGVLVGAGMMWLVRWDRERLERSASEWDVTLVCPSCLCPSDLETLDRFGGHCDGCEAALAADAGQ